MRVAVLGVGAIGGAVAGYLSGAGHDVTGFDEWPDHVSAIERDGLRVSGARGERSFRFRAAAWSELGTLAVEPDLVFVCVKTYDTARAADALDPVLGAATTVVSTQNGINEDLLAERLGRERVVGAVTEVGGYMEGPGAIVESRADGGFVIGELDGSETSRIAEVQAALSACAPTTVTRTIRSALWSKLTWNCMMNPLTAATGLGQGEIWTSAELSELAVQVGREAAAVARADGADLEPLPFLGVDLPALVDADAERAGEAKACIVGLYRPQSGKSTSMREDVKHRRRTEIDALNGHVVSVGRRHGVPVELNAALVGVMHAIERGEAQPGVDLVASLEAAA